MAASPTVNQRIGYISVVAVMAIVCAAFAITRCSHDSEPRPVADTVRIEAGKDSTAVSGHRKNRAPRKGRSHRRKQKAPPAKRQETGSSRDFLSEPAK